MKRNQRGVGDMCCMVYRYLGLIAAGWGWMQGAAWRAGLSEVESLPTIIASCLHS